MRILIAAAIMIFSLYAVSMTAAQRLYTWTDGHGILHITEQQPPPGAEVKDVMTYTERTPAELEAIERRKARERREFDEYRQGEKQRRARIRAKEAEERALESIEQAREDYQKNAAYIDKLSNRKWKRKKFRKKIERLKNETEESFAEAKSSAQQAAEAKAAAEALSPPPEPSEEMP